MRFALWGLALGLGVSACRGRAVDQSAENDLRHLVDSLMPAVERSVGLKFTHRPLSAIRSREQVRAYILHKLDAELPVEKARGLQAAYRLLGLLPDSLELRPLLLDLFTEQIIGFYEPDSSTLFVVSGADRLKEEVTVAHELVHALQHQYLPLDSIMRQQGDNDRLSAAQAILEGQATIGGLQVMVPKQNLIAMPEFWETYRESLRQEQDKMPVFARTPRLIRESVIFPYLAGADFLRWWFGSEHRDTMPFGPRMPVSTEQILHPYRYNRGDVPIPLEFVDSSANVLHEDVLGEFEIRVLAAELTKASEVTTPIAIGWGGDRYRVVDSPHGPALIWYTVWDDVPSRLRFLTGTAQLLESKRRLGYRMERMPLELRGHPAVRVVIAPTDWAGWGHVPRAEVPASFADAPSSTKP